ncbi:MAG TPA: hypothetical protein VMM84_11310 [Pyrinomonadaceae bacterium]|nr:hypothetical protein [Pyrinomonadaceae bacterium]
MKKRTIRLLGALAVAAGAFGAAGAFFSKKRNMGLKKQRSSNTADVWARPGMRVTFRAELMPGREPDDRTYRIKEILPSGRVLLDGVEGEHAEGEFERIQ